ncbi:hypothetical protein GJ633_04060 [Halorubrum sp. CBA1125]|uniref:hypothetical protein n=1 Tax=Halorubrum sp. CBA1125 TaxID=2668072 RepID=UPI0012E89085|nr:hypothetical protein [Halorubrum sp. CBA1125]MUW13926.1 hypothetical protein [Halorubrum sp. CBA1125]
MTGAKGVQISNVDLPDSLNPGDRATARIDATNTSNWISPWDQDRCNEGNNYGLLIEGVLVGPNGEEHVGETVCAEQHDIVASYEATSRVTFDAPETDGSHRYEAFIRTAESGEESSRVSKTIDVYGDDSSEPVDPPDDSGGFSGWIGDSDGSGSDGGGLPWLGGDQDVFDKIDTLVLLVILIASFYAAGQLFDIEIGDSVPS